MNGVVMAEVTPISLTDVQPIITALQNQISVSNIVSVLAGVVGVTIGIVFMWWIARKATRMIFSAFRGGKQSV